MKALTTLVTRVLLDQYCDITFVRGTRGWYEVDEDLKVLGGPRTDADLDAIQADIDAHCAAEHEAEMKAEFGMSWVAGGGSASDVGAAWAMHQDSWNGVELV